MLQDLTRCLGEHNGERCARLDQCQQHTVLREGMDYRSCADRLCYSGYTFYIAETADAAIRRSDC